MACRPQTSPTFVSRQSPSSWPPPWGRVVDGRLNNYTKLYPDEAGKVTFPVPVTAAGSHGLRGHDGDRRQACAALRRPRRGCRGRSGPARQRGPDHHAARSLQNCRPSPTRRSSRCRSASGVLVASHVAKGVPVYSANALVPFGHVSQSNLADFSLPSILWGIDGNFDINLVPADQEVRDNRSLWSTADTRRGILIPSTSTFI